MAQMVSATRFADFLGRCVANRCGYIMGSRGQEPQKWAVNSWWFTQYADPKQREKALYWRANAPRVFDCNGLAEGFYRDETGADINTYARVNYSTWCRDYNGTDMKKLPRVPGAAVFMHSSSAGYITHVGFLERPVNAGQPDGDWYVVEARGVMHGVVRTKLGGRGWNRWGLMKKYFEYDGDAVKQDFNLGERVLRIGDCGADVACMQEALITRDYSCGRYGADGEFGEYTRVAVAAFQADAGLLPDGVYSAATHAALMAQLPEDAGVAGESEAPWPVDSGAVSVPRLVATGGVNLRAGPGAEFVTVKVLGKGDVIAEGWVQTVGGYVSLKYCEIVG